LAILNEMKEAVRRGTNQPVKKAKAHPKKGMTQSMEDLIGLLGEIHAFRALRKKYGVAIVGPSNWISENSTYVFPKNLVSDIYGYDFKLQANGKIYYIEVKSSQGDEQVFELVSSEIRKAIEIANKRKEKYIIFHVTEALSSKPIFQFLPNPYDKQYRNAYKIFDAGLRIQYDRYRN